MTRRHYITTLPRPSHSRTCAALIAAAFVASSAQADQILVVQDHTLTDYRASATGVQGVQPLFQQRGVHLDGTLHHAPTHPLAIAGNPFGEQWNQKADFSGVRLDTGTFTVDDIDLALPAPGFRWVIGRTYNVRQWSGSAYIDSDSAQGKNWFQTSQPELVYYDYGNNGTDDANDAVYLIYGADRYIEFRRYNHPQNGLSADTFRAVNGAAGAIVVTEQASAPDEWVYYDPNGYQVTFFGIQGIDDTDIPDAKEGQLWKIVDPAGNVAHVGDDSTDATNAANALSAGYDSNGHMLYAIDTAGRRYDYAHTTLDNVDRLTSITVKEWNGSSWDATGDKVVYDYYQDTQNTEDDYGLPGDLRRVTVTRPMTVTTDEIELDTYYRYYTAAWSGSAPGNPHHIQYIFSNEGLRKWDYTEEGDSSLDNGYLVAHIDNDDLKPYASAYFEYEDDAPGSGDHRRITKAWFNGDCGCGGSGNDGTYLFTYEDNANYTNNAGYDTTWATRTVIEGPAIGSDELWITQYFDEVGQPLGHVISDGDPGGIGSPNHWATYVVRGDGGLGGGSEADGLIESIHTPENILDYDHDDSEADGEFDTDTDDGLVVEGDRMDGLSNPDGCAVGFPKEYTLKEGTGGTGETGGAFGYKTTHTTLGDKDFEQCRVDGGACPAWPVTHIDLDDDAVTYDYTYYDGMGENAPLTVKQITVNYPAVSTSKNGSGSSNTEKHYFNKDGTLAWSKSTDGIISYREYTDGQLTKLVEDGDTDAMGFPTPPTGFSSDGSGDENHRVTTYTYDDRGRLDTTTLPDGRVLKNNYSYLKDGRLVALQYADYDGGTGRFYGPVQYTVTNQAGQVEVSATVALDDNSGEYTTDAIATHIDETDDDPILAADGTSGFGDVARMITSIYNEPGVKLTETRSYFAVPASGEGTSTANYDPTTVQYDDRGRQVRTQSADGTITRISYDARNNVTAREIGTDDSGGVNDNMVKFEEIQYDGGSAGKNGLLTKRTQDPDGNWSTTSDQRITEFSYNYKGQLLLQKNPQAPHIFNEYNDDDELKAVGLYSSTANITIGTHQPSTHATDRLALTEYEYDEMHRVWKSIRRKIAQSDGSIVTNGEIETLRWWDAPGRVIKTEGDQLTKTFYDRLGRQTHQFILASVNDTGYADADDVSGDIVVEEYQTIYESGDSDDVIMTAAIERLWNDKDTGETTGPLDTNADGDDLLYTPSNIEGRIQITANWYDRLGRITDTVLYGTFGIENGSGTAFDRDGLGVPARSDTALLTEYAYNADGSLGIVTDPRAKETRYTYDDAGRQTKVIANYVDGTPGGGTNDDEDQTIVYVYTDGLLTKMTADLAGTTDDQETIYTYGVDDSQTPASVIAVNNLLRQVKYPDFDSGATRDYMLYAYNALGERVSMEDQANNLIDTSFDTAGRISARIVTTLASGFDGAVRRIEYTYDNLGRQDKVTQYDATSSGNVVDEAKFTYDDWGPISKVEQDHNSTVATGGTYLYDIDYTYERATGGRNTVRRTGLTLPSGNVMTYTYLSTNGLHDDELSRVTQVKDGSVVTARYRYNGAGTVVGINYPEADVFSHQYSGSTFPDLDRFNRVTSSRWTKDLATDVDFFDTDVTYDRNSNVELVEDNIHSGRDVDYSIDALNRLIKAEEGTWNGSSITTRSRQEIWTLTQTGNWDLFKLDLNGDNDFIDTDELNDDRTHNKVNELTARDVDDNGTDDYTLTFDANGNLTDDGENYQYVFDAFNRLRQVKNGAKLVAEFRYNGLNYRITAQHDTNLDGVLDGSDTTLHFVYDERWRIVAVFEDDDSNPHEEFVHHNAGADGFGGSSYIDDMVFRDRDTDGNGTLEERLYYCQNWRHDVVALVNDVGELIEQVRYSAYGVPFAYPTGDTDSDGDWDATDSNNISLSLAYTVRKDANLDGVIDSNDVTHANSITGGYQTLGRLVLTSTGVESVLGYAGYVHDAKLAGAKWHVRYRVLDSELGRWLTRDPAIYLDGPSLYQYVQSAPLSSTDPSGLFRANYGGSFTFRYCFRDFRLLGAVVCVSGTFRSWQFNCICPNGQLTIANMFEFCVTASILPPWHKTGWSVTGAVEVTGTFFDGGVCPQSGCEGRVCAFVMFKGVGCRLCLSIPGWDVTLTCGGGLGPQPPVEPGKKRDSPLFEAGFQGCLTCYKVACGQSRFIVLCSDPIAEFFPGSS